MTVAWGLLAPVGILLALFYKVVWPNGQWFYVSHLPVVNARYYIHPLVRALVLRRI